MLSSAVPADIVTPEVQKFIRDHENDDERTIILKQKEILHVPSHIIAGQIAGRRKAREKLPLHYNTEGIVYPPALNLEQSSSEKTANFKSAILKAEANAEQSFTQGIDLTGGFGIDTFFLSRHFSRFHYVEPVSGLLEIAKHNHYLLGANNIVYHNTTAEKFLEEFSQKADMIFIDPSRRSDNRKVFTLKDSAPNVIGLQEKIFELAPILLVKASPMLDIKQGIKELPSVKKVAVVGVENEVKELLFLCAKGFDQEPLIEAIDLNNTGIESFGFLFSGESPITVRYHDPVAYLYEPNASILKAGAFKSITTQFDMNKIAPNTHLYTSCKLFENFPGRIFQIEQHVKPAPKELRQHLPHGKANIITRNYPLSVDSLKKKIRINDGGEKYLIAFSGINEKFLVIANRRK